MSWRMRRLVALSSTIKHRKAAEIVQDRGDRRRGSSTPLRPNRTTNEKVLPSPTRLSSSIFPPIISTRRQEIARPSPVPPYFRVVEPSACSNGEKIVDCFSGGIPMPVSATANRSPTSSPSRHARSTVTRTSPRSVNLTALPTRFTRTCRKRPPSPIRIVRHVRGDVEGQLQVLLVGPQGERPHRVAQAIAQVERAGVEVELARLDLREVEDVVDHRQQRVGRRCDDLQVLALLGRELGVQDQLGHADDAVHRGADLVAHVGEELALGPAGRLGGLLGAAQFLLGPLPHADVLDRQMKWRGRPWPSRTSETLLWTQTMAPLLAR